MLGSQPKGRRSALVHTSEEHIALPPEPRCDESLWKHVYTGDPRRFDSPKGRLKVLDPRKTVTGKIVTMVGKPDADYHIQIKLDAG